MRIPYCTNISDPGTDKELLLDVECELDVSRDQHGISIDAVYIDGVNLFASPSKLFRLLACEIADRAESDPYVFRQIEPMSRRDYAESRADDLHQMAREMV